MSFSKILNIGYIKQTDLVTRWKNRRLQFFNFQQGQFPIHSVPSSLTESLKACTLTFFFTQLGKIDIISLSNIVHSNEDLHRYMYEGLIIKKFVDCLYKIKTP